MENLNDIILENAGLIWKIAKRYPDICKYDLYQAGCLGIIKAYQNYQKNGKTKFSTYAYDYILGEMSLLNNNREIKTSRNLKKIYYMLERKRYELAQSLGYIPNNKELASFLKMDEKDINEALALSYEFVSLDVKDDNSRALYEVIPAKENVSLDDLILLNSCINELNPLEQNIINCRYFEDLTQSQTAKKLGVTQVMVSRYETRSLEKMRTSMHM